MYKQLNHTPVSNDFIDGALPNLKGSDVKVFIVISRKVIGWGNEVKKNLSFTDIIKLTGLSKNIVTDAIKSLCKREVITMETKGKGRATTHSFSVNYVPESGTITEKNVPESGTIQKKVPKSGTIISPSVVKRSTKSTQKVTHSRKKPLPLSCNISRSSKSSRITSNDNEVLVGAILKEEMFIQNLPPAGKSGKFRERIIELFTEKGASWFRAYAKWYGKEKKTRIGWSPSMFVYHAMVNEFDSNREITLASRAMKGVRSEAFLKRSREFQASVLKHK